mgnify:CR=1 FL=1
MLHYYLTKEQQLQHDIRIYYGSRSRCHHSSWGYRRHRRFFIGRYTESRAGSTGCYAEAQHAQGKEFKVGLITGGATGCQVDSALVKAHAVSFRTPFQSNKDMRESINQHEVQYFDLHLSQIGQDVRYCFLGKST